MNIKTEYISQEQHYVLKIIGELDTIAASNIQSKIEEIADNPDKDLVIDCSELSYIASAGLRLFLVLRKAFGKTQHKVSLTSVKKEVSLVLSITNLDKLFEIK